LRNSVERLSELAAVRSSAMASKGLTVSFAHEMPTSIGLTEIVLEVMEGRHDGEAVIVRNAHVFERRGRMELVLTMHGVDDETLKRRITRWLAGATKLLVQDAESRALGYDPLNPPLHVLRSSSPVRDVLKACGADDYNIVVKGTADGGRHINIMTGTIAMETFHRRGFHVSLALKAGKLQSIRMASEGSHPLRIIDLEGSTEISIGGVNVPETMVGAIPGRRLGEVIAHPVLTTSMDLRIEKATVRRDQLLNDFLVVTVEASDVQAFGRRR